MASGGSKQRKTRWDDSRARERDETPSVPPQPPEPGGGSERLGDSGRGLGEGAEESRVQPGRAAEAWLPQGENRGSQEQVVQGPASHEQWAHQGDVGRAADPWVQQGSGRESAEPWHQQGDGNGTAEPWVQQGETREATAAPGQQGDRRGPEPHMLGRAPQDPALPPSMNMAPQEPWGQQIVNPVSQEQVMPQVLNMPPQDPWGSHGVVAGQDPWGQQAVPMTPQDPWGQPGMNVVTQEPWQQQAPNVAPQQPWIQHGTNMPPQQPWIQHGPNAATQQPWVQHGPNAAPQQPWVQQVPNTAPQQPWVQQGQNAGPQQPWGQHAPNAAPQQPWGQHGPNAAPPQQWGQQGPNMPPQQPWGQHGPNSTPQQPWAQHGPNAAPQQPWTQHGPNVVFQEQQGRMPQEPWGQQEEGRWRAPQENWGPQGENRGSKKGWGPQGQNRGRGSRDPWGQQWEGREQGSQKQWKPQGEGRERGSHGPWGHQGDGRDRRSRGPWGHRGDGRGRGSRGPWVHHGEGRDRGSHVSWGQPGQNRGGQDAWRQQEDGRVRESQKPWGHRKEDRRAHEPWGQQGDVPREKGSVDSWGHQEMERNSGLHEEGNQQRGGMGGSSSVPWVQRGGGEGGMTPGYDENSDLTLKKPWAHHDRHREKESLDSFKAGDSGLPTPCGQQLEVSQIVLPEPIGQPLDAADRILGQLVWQETVRSDQPPLKQEESIESRLEDSMDQHVEMKEVVFEEQEGKQQHGIVVCTQEPLRQPDELKGLEMVEPFEKADPVVLIKPVEECGRIIEGLSSDILEEGREKVCEEEKVLNEPLKMLLVSQISSDISVEQHEKGSGEALGEEKEKSDEPVKHHDESRVGGSSEPIGNNEGCLEEVVVPYENCSVWQSEELVVQHKPEISGESVAQHDDCKFWQSEETLGQYGEGSKGAPEELTQQHEDVSERDPEKPINQPQECKDGVYDVAILRPDWVRDLTLGLSIEEDVVNEGYLDNDKVLEQPVRLEGGDLGLEASSVALVKDGERASDEILPQHDLGLRKLSSETVEQQHEQAVEGLPLEYMGPQLGTVEGSHQKPVGQEQGNLLMEYVEPVSQQELAPQDSYVHPESSIGSMKEDFCAEQDDVKQAYKETEENATQETFVTEELSSSKPEVGEDRLGEVSLQTEKPLEPRETSEESMLRLEGSKLYTNIDIKEWQVEEDDSAVKSNELQRELEYRGSQKESLEKGTEKQKLFEDEGDIEIKNKISVEEEPGVRVESKHRRHRVPEEEWDTHREKRHSSRVEERSLRQLEDADMPLEDDERGISTKMKHRRHRAHDGDRGAHRERKRMTEEVARAEVDDNKDIKAVNTDDVDYCARDEMRLRRHRGYQDDTGNRKPTGKEEERYEEDDYSEHGMKDWDWEKNEGAIIEEQTEPWSGRMHVENEDRENASEIAPWSSKKERKKEEKDSGRERKHKGRERRERQEDDTGGERRHGGSRKKRRRDKSWEDEEGADGEKKHRSREHRREKLQALEADGRDGHMKTWSGMREGQRQNEEEGEQWAGSREMDAEDYGVEMSEDMLYWSSQDQDQQDKVVDERKRESSRKERKRRKDGEEVESERKYWGGTERQGKREEDVGGQESKSSRKKERKREHEDAGGGERKHRSSRKKQRRREEDEFRDDGSKQWSDNENERKKGRLDELDGEDEGEGKFMGDKQERNRMDEGGDLDIIDNNNRLETSRKEEFEYYLSARKKEQHMVELDMQNLDAQSIQSNVCEKESKRGKLPEQFGEVGQVKDSADREKEGIVEDDSYTEVVWHKMLEHNDREKQRYNDGEIVTKVDRTDDQSTVARRDVELDWEREGRENLGGEDVLSVLGFGGSSEKNTESEIDARRKEEHAPGVEAKVSQLKEVDVVEQNNEPGLDRIREQERSNNWDVQHVTETEERQLVRLEDGRGKFATGRGEWIDGGKSMIQNLVSVQGKESEGSDGGYTKHTIGLEKQLDGSGGEVRHEPPKKPRRMFLEDPGTDYKPVYMKEERRNASLEGGEEKFLTRRVEGTKVEHAFGIYPKQETVAVVGGGGQTHITGLLLEKTSEQYLQQEYGKNIYVDVIPQGQPVFTHFDYLSTMGKESETLPTHGDYFSTIGKESEKLPPHGDYFSTLGREHETLPTLGDYVSTIGKESEKLPTHGDYFSTMGKESEKLPTHGDYFSTMGKESEKLLTLPSFQDGGVGGKGKDGTVEKPAPPTQDGSIRERERRREMLLRSLASFKESVGAERKKEQPPTKEDVGRFGGKESMKIELLSPALSRQLAAGAAKERKKDNLVPPPSKEEKSSSKEKKEESQTTTASKDLDGEERCVGPLPAEASQTRRKKVLEFERVYLDNLPSAAMYERSYMHRDVITHVACTNKIKKIGVLCNLATCSVKREILFAQVETLYPLTFLYVWRIALNTTCNERTDFIITASHDGHVKFWKKIAEGIEFVKHFRSHLGVIESIAVSAEGALFCSVGEDQAMKVFDVVNFDMINMLKLGYHPGHCEWIFCPGDAISAVASSEKSTGKIYVYDGRGTNKPMHIFERLHSSPLTQIRLNSVYKVVVSADKTGMMEYWTGPPQEYKFPKNVHWEYKTDTDLYEFAKCKAHLTSMCFSSDGKKIATIGSDRKVRIFRFLTGKLMRVFDESLSMFTELQQMRQQLPDMEFGRRMAVERELEKVDAIRLINIIFDETGHFVLYGTMLGIKVINVETNRCVRILGKQENVRIVHISMFQGVARKHRTATTVEMKASDNPVLMSIQADPTIVCTAFKKNRFYLFSRREPEDTKSADSDRDVFNEKPSKEEVMAATQAEGPKRVSDSAIVHTSMGDVHVKLFPVECPKTVENFCVHSRNGYYNGHTFHRIIKGFMVQTGDPSGTGMGGESIWGGEFEDEFHSTLRHDRPYTLSMANAGPNSNGSQFFLTVVPTPWLDNKHTVFGRVTKGMEVVQRISNVKVNPKTDKPYEDISIISITVK